jgi:hypothetical protein
MALRRITRHALEKDPNDRFQSARDLAFASSPSRYGRLGWPRGYGCQARQCCYCCTGTLAGTLSL